MLYPLPHDVVMTAYRDYVYSYRRDLEESVACAELENSPCLDELMLAKRITAGYDDEVNQTD